MAEKKSKEKKQVSKVVVERTYNVPLRKGFIKVPLHKRSNRAMTELRNFLTRHMKSETIRIGPMLNQKVWQSGMKNPPHHVKVVTVKMDSGEVNAELFGAPKFWEVVEEKKAKKDETKKDEKKPIEQAVEQPKDVPSEPSAPATAESDPSDKPAKKAKPAKKPAKK